MDFHFNISHSGDWVVLATGPSPLGIDVERIKDIDLDIAKRFFSGREYDDLMLKPDEERFSYFFNLWTLKESYIKAVGKGLSLPLDSFSMVMEDNRITIKTESDDNRFFRQYPVAAGYKLSICASGDSFPGEIIHKTPDDLYYEFITLHEFWNAG